MRYCPKCKIDMFGGSLCDQCGGQLIEKKSEQRTRSVQVTQDMIMGGSKHLKSELAQSVGGRIFRLLIEIVLFVAIFYGVSWLFVGIINFLSINMSSIPKEATAPLDWNGSGMHYYLLIGGIIVTILTVKIRWQAGK